eukprot:6859945-Lingulodinium_polyedra.AAC.1
MQQNSLDIIHALSARCARSLPVTGVRAVAGHRQYVRWVYSVAAREGDSPLYSPPELERPMTAPCIGGVGALLGARGCRIQRVGPQ